MNNLNSHYKNLVGREKAEEILATHVNQIKSACLEGHAHFMEFVQKCPNLRFALNPRTVSGFINDWVVQVARINFMSVKNVEIVDDLGFFCFVFDKTLLLRFKKADEDGRTSNVRTRQQEEIAAQVLEFQDWENVTWISAAYHLTKTADAIDRICINCWYGDRDLWSIPIFEHGMEEPVLPFAETVASPKQQPAPKVKVRAKNLKKPEEHA